MRTVVLIPLFLLSACQSPFIRTEGKCFAVGHTHFVPWGANYGHHGKLIEDVWNSDWPAIEKDFAELHAMGANVVRIHLQLNKFMQGPDRPNAAALVNLRRLLDTAERHQLYLDLTGLACYRESDVPPWLDKLSESQRWNAQANFWRAIARTSRGSPAVFCYDLINEPVVAGGPVKSWYTGKLGGLNFLQFINLDAGHRKREDVARQWVSIMVAAIHREDRRHLVTVGMLPWDSKWHFLSGFVPQELAPQLDFICVHIYPQTGKMNEAMEGLRKFSVGKPVVIEETFPLSCSPAEEKDFLLRSRGIACGWIGHYDGDSLEELRAKKKAGTLTINQAMYLAWLELFEKLRPEMLRWRAR